MISNLSSSGKNDDLWWRSSHGNSSMNKNSRMLSSVWNTCWKGSGIDVIAELDGENDFSVITFIGSESVDEGLENDCTAWFSISKGLKGTSPLKESSSDSKGTIQGSSNGIVIDVIIFILAIVRGTLGGGIEKFPIKAESFTKPTQHLHMG